MKNKLLIFIFVFCANSHRVLAQNDIEKSQIFQSLKSLCISRAQYESCFEDTKKNISLVKRKILDSSLNAYKQKIKAVKKQRNTYLKHIDSAIVNGNLNNKRQYIPYHYFPKKMSIDPRYTLITQLDMYKIIRYSLFERDDSILPDLKDVPFYDKKKLQPIYPTYTHE